MIPLLKEQLQSLDISPINEEIDAPKVVHFSLSLSFSICVNSVGIKWEYFHSGLLETE
jgi:hypothetical protein